MSPHTLVTGATGQLGRLVLAELARRTDPGAVAALARHPAADLGVPVRQGDYTRPDTLDAALVGIERLLLISSNAVGARTAQHANVLEAARRAGVRLVVYTSLLRADTSPLDLGVEHRETEALLRASGLPWVILRNGWYTENFTGGLDAALAAGAVIGSSGSGRIAAAARADYAAAAAAVLAAGAFHAGQTYELAGDTPFTMADFAAALTRASGRAIAYHDLPQDDYAAVLVGAGLPPAFAALLAQSSAASARGALDSDSHDLRRLIGRPTTPLATTLAAALAPLPTPAG